MRVTSSSRDSPNSSSRRLHPTSTTSVSPAYLAHLSSSTTFQSFLRSIGPPHPSATSIPSTDAASNSPALPPANPINSTGYLPPRDMPDVLLQARAHQRRLLRDFPSRRHSSNLGNELRRAALQGITTPPVTLGDGSENARDRETGDERPNSKRIKRECNEDEPLQFEVLYEDGGHFSATYGIENILRDDSLVYCSKRKGNINILMRFNDWDRKSMDSACVITKLVVKSPVHGFTAPCKEGLMFISHDPIPVEATSRFDNFTQADYEEYTLRQHDHDVNDDCRPAAFFRLMKGSQLRTEVELNHRSGKYVLIKLLRAEGETDNIDIQYIGFIGYTGARSFANGTLC